MKIISTLLLAAFLVFIPACSSDDSAETNEKEETVQVDKGLLNVELTVPASMLEGGEMNEIIEEAEKEDITVTENEDGSLTYKMSKSKHKEVLKDIEESIEENIAELTNGADYPSIKAVKHNKDFTEFTMTTVKEEFENSFDSFAILGLGMYGSYYQMFNGINVDEISVKLNVKDEATEEIFSEVIFPDDLETPEEDSESES